MANEWNPPEAFIEDCLFGGASAQILRHLPGAAEGGVVHRQFSIPRAGVADLVIFSLGRISVVEIKRTTIDEGAVAQCLRYIGALNVARAIGDERLRDMTIEGILCAPAITETARFAMAGCGAILHYYQCSPTLAVTHGGASSNMSIVSMSHSGEFADSLLAVCGEFIPNRDSDHALDDNWELDGDKESVF